MCLCLTEKVQNFPAKCVNDNKASGIVKSLPGVEGMNLKRLLFLAASPTGLLSGLSKLSAAGDAASGMMCKRLWLA